MYFCDLFLYSFSCDPGCRVNSLGAGDCCIDSGSNQHFLSIKVSGQFMRHLNHAINTRIYVLYMCTWLYCCFIYLLLSDIEKGRVSINIRQVHIFTVNLTMTRRTCWVSSSESSPINCRISGNFCGSNAFLFTELTVVLCEIEMRFKFSPKIRENVA